MAAVLVVHASRHGSTMEVAERIGGRLRAAGLAVEVRAAREARAPVEGYDLVVVGGALYSGRWPTAAHRFLQRQREPLSRTPVAIFGMGPRRDDPEAWRGSESQLGRALVKHGWLTPLSVIVFGGRDPQAKHGQPRRDLRDWPAIEAWADHLGSVVAGWSRPG